jgi:hypothetical protein
VTDPAGHRLRRIGWLLTPLVVWAASFVGAWLGALGARRVQGPWGGVGVMVVGAAVLAGVTLILWVLLLRWRARPPTSDTSE